MPPCSNRPFPSTAKPNPTESSENPAVVTRGHRNVFCSLYDRCLNEVVKRGWSNWTCRRCELMNATPAPSAAMYANDRPRNRGD